MKRTLTCTCEVAPVQFEGDIDGNPFYFRAWSNSWSSDLVEPGANPIRTATAAREEKLLYHCCSIWGEEIADASCMPKTEAERIIHLLLDQYEQGTRGTVDGCSLLEGLSEDQQRERIRQHWEALLNYDPLAETARMNLKRLGDSK